jgi:hypothetical protein
MPGPYPAVAMQGPIDLDPAPRCHPVRPVAAGDDLRPEPTGEPFDAPVSAVGLSNQPIHLENNERLLDERAHHINRQPVAPPIIGHQFDSENGSSIGSARPAEATAATESARIGREDPDLEVPARIFALPGQEAIEELVRPPLVSVREAVKTPIPRQKPSYWSWPHLRYSFPSVSGSTPKSCSWARFCLLGYAR